MRSTITVEQQKEAVENSFSVAGVMRYLGKNPSTGHHDRIKKLIIQYGIDTTHFTGQGWNAGSIQYDTYEVFSENSKAPRYKVRKYVIRDSLIPYKCAFCGNTGEWLGKPMALELDHINGKPNDHRLSNLRFLCPNCHATTDTYCGKNKQPSEKKQYKTKVNEVKRPTQQELKTLLAEMSKNSIAKHFHVSPTTIDRWCEKYGIPHRKEDLIPHRSKQRKNTKNDKQKCFCRICGKQVKTKALCCGSCAKRRVIERPTPISLAEELCNSSFVTVGKKYGVSDNAIRKWCVSYGIPIKKPAIKEWLSKQ